MLLFTKNMGTTRLDVSACQGHVVVQQEHATTKVSLFCLSKVCCSSPKMLQQFSINHLNER
jgi:hypothetical protein